MVPVLATFCQVAGSGAAPGATPSNPSQSWCVQEGAGPSRVASAEDPARSGAAASMAARAASGRGCADPPPPPVPADPPPAPVSTPPRRMFSLVTQAHNTYASSPTTAATSRGTRIVLIVSRRARRMARLFRSLLRCEGARRPPAADRLAGPLDGHLDGFGGVDRGR